MGVYAYTWSSVCGTQVLPTMKEFCFFLCLLLVLPGSLSECTFRDESLFDGTFDMDESTTGNDYGIFEHHNRKGYIWENHRVFFTYNSSMSQELQDEVDRFLEPVINGYERNTCISFHKRGTWNIPDHHLMINAIIDNPKCGTHGDVSFRPFSKNEMVMNIHLPLQKNCRHTAVSLIYHEMGHVMGIMHTHKRYDRDNYVIYRKECHKPDPVTDYQFKIIPNRPGNKQLKYECNSIMHYWRNAFHKDDCVYNCQCNVLSPQPRSTCKAIDPAKEPTPEDWKLIKWVQDCPGPIV